MAYALAKGLVNQGWAPASLCASDPDARQRERFAEAGIKTLADNAEVVRDAEAVLLAVKPQVMAEVLSPLAGLVSDSQMVLSVAAGVSIHRIRSCLGVQTLPVVRIMPNTPALVGHSASALYGESLTDAHKCFATEVMGATGQTLWVDEEDALAVVTAVSGSGPAYFLYLIEQLAAAGTRLGLSQVEADALVLQTALGTAQLARQTGEAASVLRAQVTSPGGTTEAAIKRLQAGEFENLIEAAVLAAHKRAQELDQEG